MARDAVSVDALFQALADGPRRAALERLRAGPASVSELARAAGRSLSAMDRHLAVLSRAGLVESRKDGRVRTVALLPARLEAASAWLSAYRELAGRFDAGAPFIDLSDMDVT